MQQNIVKKIYENKLKKKKSKREDKLRIQHQVGGKNKLNNKTKIRNQHIELS